MNVQDGLKTLALFLIAASLFTLSWVIHDVMGKHSRYAVVDVDENEVTVMDTHTGRIWSRSLETEEDSGPVALTPIGLRNR